MAKTAKKRKVAAESEVPPGWRKTPEEVLAGTLVRLSEPPRKICKLDTTEETQIHDTEHTQGDDFIANPTPIPRCEQFAVERRAVDNTFLGELLYHRSTRILEARLVASGLPNLATSIPRLFNYLFLSDPYPYYRSVCFKPTRPYKENGDCRDIYYTRSAIHLAIFNHILKRISCLPIIEAEGYRINDHCSSATDSAFVYFLSTLLKQTDISAAGSHFQNIKDHGITLAIKDDRAIRAFEIFTQHPMGFLVQMKVGQLLQTEYVAVVWCQDVGTEGKWDVVWEYMRKQLAAVVCAKANYEF